MKIVKVTKVQQGKQERRVINLPRAYWPVDDYLVIERVNDVIILKEVNQVKFELMGLDEPDTEEST